MAKGDKKKMQQRADEQRERNYANQEAIQSQAITPEFSRNQAFYDEAARTQMADYGDIMNRYRQLSEQGVGQNQPGLERVNYTRPGEMNEAFGGYRDFMNTGGYSDENIRDMRARGVSPIRASYANALNEVDRQKNLAGGYSPNAAALRAKMAGSQGQQMADAVQDINARLAEAVNSGKRFGIQGMGGLSVQDAELAQRAALANQQAGLEIARNNLMDPRMNAVHGMASMFGTTPGMARMFGDQTQQSIQNWLANNQIGQQAGRDMMSAQQQVANTPSNFEVGFGRVKEGIDLAGKGAQAWMGVPGIPKPKVPGPVSPYGSPSNIYSQNISGGGYLPSRRI